MHAPRMRLARASHTRAASGTISPAVALHVPRMPPAHALPAPCMCTGAQLPGRLLGQRRVLAARQLFVLMLRGLHGERLFTRHVWLGLLGPWLLLQRRAHSPSPAPHPRPNPIVASTATATAACAVLHVHGAHAPTPTHTHTGRGVPTDSPHGHRTAPCTHTPVPHTHRHVLLQAGLHGPRLRAFGLRQRLRWPWCVRQPVVRVRGRLERR